MRGLAIDLATAHQTRQRLGYPGGEFEQDECLARRQAERTARILGNAPQQPAKLPLALRAERTVLMPFAQYQLQNRPALDQVVEIGGIGRAGTLAIARLCAIQRGQDARRQPVQMLKEQRVDHRGNTVEIYVEEAAADPDPVGHLAQRDVECPAFADQRLRCVEQLLLAITLCRHGFHAPAVPRTHEIGKVATPTLPRFITIGLTVRSRLVTLNTKRGRTGMSEGIRRGMTRRGLIKAGSAAGALAVTAPALAARQATAAAVAEASEWREITPALTGYIAGARGHRIPAAIRERARLHILDTLAAIVACRPLEAAKLGRSYAAAMSPHGESPILASRQTASSVDAVFASAMTAHAAEINDFTREAAKSYRHVSPEEIEVVLLQSGSRILPVLHEELADFSHKLLVQRSVEIRLNTRIKEATAQRAILGDGKAIPTRTLVAAIGDPGEAHDEDVVKAAVSMGDGAKVGRALYFSRRAVPGGGVGCRGTGVRLSASNSESSLNPTCGSEGLSVV